MPYERFVREHAQERDLIPNVVVRRNIIDNMPMARAWREHLGLTQAALSQIEPGQHKPRKATLTKLAAALGITVEQLT